MSLHDDLLDQARHLATREPSRPRQASLRRAVSTAYYAVFHLLIDAALKSLVRDAELRPRFARAFEHTNLKSVSRAFASAQPNQLIELTGGESIPEELEIVANAVFELQIARHGADYDLSKRFSRLEANDLVNMAADAFAAWDQVRTEPVARAYLAAVLIWKHWKR